jgi:hypothetical protein
MDVDMAVAWYFQLNALLPESDKISVNDFIVKRPRGVAHSRNINASAGRDPRA